LYVSLHESGVDVRAERRDVIMAALNVNPDDMYRTAHGWRSYAAAFVSQTPPTIGDGDGWPSKAATERFHDSMHSANNSFHRRMHANADQMDESANDYSQQDQYGAADIQAASPNGSAATASGMASHKDAAAIFTGTFKDLSGGLTAGLSAAASGFGALGSSGASAAGALANATTQIGTTLAQNGAKMAPATAMPAMAGVGGNVAHAGSSKDDDNQTRTASASPAAASPATAVAPAGAVLARDDRAATSSTAVTPAGMAPHVARSSTTKTVRSVIDNHDDQPTTDRDDKPTIQVSPVVHSPAFAQAVVEVPDAGKS
jgi:hypothetical protein